MEIKINEKDNGVTIECRVSPRAGRNAIKRITDGVLHISLAAPPIEGRANKALVDFLSSIFSIPPSKISITMGKQNRLKVVYLEGLDKQTVIKRLINPSVKNHMT